jgi:hypothetical protein
MNKQSTVSFTGVIDSVIMMILGTIQTSKRESAVEQEWLSNFRLRFRLTRNEHLTLK